MPSRLLPQVPIEVKEDWTLQVKLVRILDRNDKELRNKKVPLAKVLWRNSKKHGGRVRNKEKES
jgi:hypothetical protein